jgi:adenylate kinase family enzyme
MSGGTTGEPPYNRIAIQGSSASGKTTLGRTLAAKLGTSHLELDSVFHQANWTPIETEKFRRIVEDFVEQPRWVTDGNYSMVRDLYWANADVIVFLDLPRRIIMRRIIRRTLTRMLLRKELWNGNREQFRNIISRDPELNIILWAWRTHGRYHDEVPALARATVRDIPVVILRSPREVREFVAQFDA